MPDFFIVLYESVGYKQVIRKIFKYNMGCRIIILQTLIINKVI